MAHWTKPCGVCRHFPQVVCILAACLGMAAFSGCGDDGLDTELAYRQIGISCMEAGNYEEAYAAFNSALGERLGHVTDTEIDICFTRRRRSMPWATPTARWRRMTRS